MKAISIDGDVDPFPMIMRASVAPNKVRMRRCPGMRIFEQTLALAKTMERHSTKWPDQTVSWLLVDVLGNVLSNRYCAPRD
jgi:hypothetical protein